MIFLMSEDHISHIPFSIWRLPRLLRFCKIKLANHQDVHKILIPTKKSHDQQKIQCPNKIPSWPTKISMSKQNFSTTNKKIFHDQQEISMSKQNFSMQNKTKVFFFFFFHTHTHKNFHTHGIGLTHSNKISTHQKWICSIKPTHQIFNTSLPTKFKSKFIHQYHKLQTLPNFISHQHCPNFTMRNNSAIQKMPQGQDYNTSTRISNQIIQCP